MFTLFNFDIRKLVLFAEGKLNEFANNHSNETFYAFAIDDGLLCLNSVSEFEMTLRKYQQSYPGYRKEDEIEDLKYNTGDWSYQGFANFRKIIGDRPQL